MPRIHPFTIGCWALALGSAAQAGDFALTSPDLAPGKPVAEQHLLDGFGCSGGNQSPALQWQGAPAGTRSYALSIYDPDAPTGSGWWHWMVVNLPAATKALARDAGKADGSGLPAGTRQLSTDFGAPGYGGPCPPAGAPAHRYVVTLHALDVETLDLPANATPALAGFMIHSHALGKAKLQFEYGR